MRGKKRRKRELERDNICRFPLFPLLLQYIKSDFKSVGVTCGDKAPKLEQKQLDNHYDKHHYRYFQPIANESFVLRIHCQKHGLRV